MAVDWRAGPAGAAALVTLATLLVAPAALVWRAR